MSDALAEQRELWSIAPRDWAEIAEPQNEPLFTRLLDATGVRSGTRLLDIACGSGLTTTLAAQRGAHTAGVDIAPALLSIAGQRNPTGTFREAQMEDLPFPDGSFDVVTCINGFQFAGDPVNALREAARVLSTDGRVGAATFAEPERNEGTVLHLAMKALLDGPEDDGHAPYALSTASGLHDAITAAELTTLDTGEIPVTWSYPDVETTLRAVLASAGGARAIRAVGRSAVRAALTEALQPFHQPDGAIRIRNLFRYVVATR